jgi:hypothetical protein
MHDCHVNECTTSGLVNQGGAYLRFSCLSCSRPTPEVIYPGILHRFFWQNTPVSTADQKTTSVEQLGTVRRSRGYTSYYDNHTIHFRCVRDLEFSQPESYGRPVEFVESRS